MTNPNMIRGVALSGLISFGIIGIALPAALAQAGTTGGLASGATPIVVPADSFDLESCVRLALRAIPDLRARRAVLEASRSDVTAARSSRYPSLAPAGSVSRFNSGEAGATDRCDVGLSVRQTLYQGGRVGAGVDAAQSAFAADEAALAAARSDLIQAVYDRRIAFAVLDRAIGHDFFREEGL